MVLIDLTGQKINNLLVLKRIPNIGKNTAWLCKCDCGNISKVTSNHLKSKKNPTISCKECLRKRKIRHGLTNTKEHKVWQDLRARCYRPKTSNYIHYGGRGISVCDRWRYSFENFLTDMGFAPTKEHSIDRIDVNGNYEPANCRWATKKEQSRNTRSNKFIEINGIKKCIIEWCEIYGIKCNTYFKRVEMGWDKIKAITHPVKKLKKHN